MMTTLERPGRGSASRQLRPSSPSGAFPGSRPRTRDSAVTALSAQAAETLLSQGRTATASSSEKTGAFPAPTPVDGNTPGTIDHVVNTIGEAATAGAVVPRTVTNFA